MSPIVNLMFTPAGAKLVIEALRKLPHEQVDDLVRQIYDQYTKEIARLEQAAAAAEPQQVELPFE
jgi:hypothetical protein